MQLFLLAFFALLTRAAVIVDYDLITRGKCVLPIKSKSECNTAAKLYDEITDKKASTDKGKKGGKSSDPEGCYFEKGKLNWNRPDRSTSGRGSCSTKDKCLCMQPQFWSTGALNAKKDYCRERINKDNTDFEGFLVMARQVVFSKDENSLTKKCEYFSKRAKPIYPFYDDRFMFNCEKTPDVCNSASIPELQKGLPHVCNMLGGNWGHCVNREKTPRKLSLKKLRNGLACNSGSNIVKDMLKIAGLSDNWIRKYKPSSKYTHESIQEHRNWWNFHHIASFKQNPLYFKALARFMDPVNKFQDGGYLCGDCQIHFTDELDIAMSEEASSNVVLALWYLHNQAQWEITSGKQGYTGPYNWYKSRHLGWTYMPTHSECPKCRTRDGWKYKEVQKHLYKEYGQKSSCINLSKSKCGTKQHCKYNKHWKVCQQKPAKSGYAVQTEGTCMERITSKSKCNEAARILGMKDTKASRDNTKGKSKSSDPSGCFYEKGALKYNEKGNGGDCSDSDICLCRVAESLRPAVTGFYDLSFSTVHNSSLFSVAQNILAVFGVFTVAYGAYLWCLGNKGYAQLSDPQKV